MTSESAPSLPASDINTHSCGEATPKPEDSKKTPEPEETSPNTTESGDSFDDSKRARDFHEDDSDDERPTKLRCDLEAEDMERCIIKPGNIRVTFEDVHVHPSVVEALENITFPLHYPKAFSYGILSKSTAPSVLLYGPPGTGKTLLVRALARKAESKILAISGGDISDKYVGVGEKKIKNMFSLARSEYPCIIFIDEADALLCSRSPNGRSCERAYLNEFLSEMEGINSRNYRNPIVIAATNRPFDMDEGILRRLGRRIMVDLPDVHAREEILKIHTRGESLDESFKISELAKNTPGYSGSDLKNLVYSAAMAAFREQLTLTKTSAGYPGPADYEVGSGRVLHKRHFLHAKREIPASPIAETVAKIREFHNKFGETIQKRGGGGPVNKIKSTVSV